VVVLRLFEIERMRWKDIFPGIERRCLRKGG